MEPSTFYDIYKNWDILLRETLFKNTVQEWFIAILAALLSFMVLRIARDIIAGRLRVLAKLTPFELDDLLVDLLAHTRWFVFIAISLGIFSLFLDLPADVEIVIRRLPPIALLVQIALWSSRIIQFFLDRYDAKSRSQADKVAAVSLLGPLRFVAQLILWVVAGLLILDNLGVNITALVAGLGIGGVAIAFALQNILGDLFAAFSIAMDRPFVVGDFITVETFSGTVEYIGLKTTRVRSVSGELIIFSNSELLKSRIRNYRPMVERRVVFNIAVDFETEGEHLESIPTWIRELIEAEPEARFDRAHFNAYTVNGLNFEVVYFVKKADYNLYMDIQQRVNLGIFRKLKESGVQFAHGPIVSPANCP